MTTGLAAFDALGRGDAAPDWVSGGIRAAWALPDAAVSLIVLSENVTFRVEVAGRPLQVVRLSRPGYGGGTDHVRSELDWIGALRADTGVRTPAPLPGADGALVQVLRAPSSEAWIAVAFEWVDGEILEDRHDVAEHYAELGRITAALHEHATGWRPPAGFTRFAWTIDDMVGADARWGDWRDALHGGEHDLLARAERRAAAIVDASLGADPVRRGLVHADLRPTNVMATRGGLCVIDFDDAGFTYLLQDFAASLTFLEHRPAAAAMAAGWLDGYRSRRPLSRAELDAAGALSMLRRLQMLGWTTTHREDALPPGLWAGRLSGTIEVAERFLHDPRWLVR